MQQLLNKVAIITGSGRGIGRGIAKHFASAGAKVVIATLDEQEGLEVEQEILQAGGSALCIPTDVESDSSIQSMVDKTIEKFSKIDVLVNNAGITLFKPLFEATLEDWNRVINIDLRGSFLCSKYVAKHMKDSGGGSIINISSNHAIATLPDTEMYAAAKGGINSMTKSMALSLGKYNIRVNAICPGFTDTPHYRTWLDQHENPSLIENEVLKLHAHGKICTPEDIANLALFLATDQSSKMTGESIVLDGGLSYRLYQSI